MDESVSKKIQTVALHYCDCALFDGRPCDCKATADVREQLSALQQELMRTNEKAGDALAALEQRNAEIEKDNGEKWLQIAGDGQRIASLEQQVQKAHRLIHELSDIQIADKERIRALETALGSFRNTENASLPKERPSSSELESALNGLLQYMGQTCDEDGDINGVSIEETHTSSLRFHAAWLRAVALIEKPVEESGKEPL